MSWLKAIFAVWRFVRAWALLANRVDELDGNHLNHLRDDIGEIKSDMKKLVKSQAEQVGVCKATRAALGLLDEGS